MFLGRTIFVNFSIFLSEYLSNLLTEEGRSAAAEAPPLAAVTDAGRELALAQDPVVLVSYLFELAETQNAFYWKQL